MRYNESMEKKIKLILLDIDGTIVNSSWDMTPLTKQTLTRLHAAGILLGIASGRPVDDISFHLKKWDLPFDFDVLVGLNGCEVHNNVTGAYSISHELDCQRLRTAVTLMQDHFDCIPFLYRGPLIHALKVDEVIRTSALKSGKQPVEVDLDTLCQSPCVKVMFRTKDGQTVAEMERFLQDTPTPGLKWFKTQETLMEVSDPDVSKALALPILCAQLDLPVEAIMACGDTTNDNEMLSQAGLGVCLANGTDDTKACADEITAIDNDHDGLARHWMEHHPELFD